MTRCPVLSEAAVVFFSFKIVRKLSLALTKGQRDETQIFITDTLFAGCLLTQRAGPKR